MRDPSSHVELTRRINDWIRRLGISDDETPPQVAVDLADILHACFEVQRLVPELLASNPNTPDDADKLLRQAARLEVQLFTELHAHVTSLQEKWPYVMDAIERRASPTTGKN